MLRKIISPTQGAFIAGRSISDNILMPYEVLHYLHRQTLGKMGYDALKVDMAKAYDIMEWDFLEKMMLKLCFHERWVKIMRGCINSDVQYSPCW